MHLLNKSHIDIAVIGAGNVGRAIGEAWLKKGRSVVYGVPDPGSRKYEQFPKNRLATPAEAAAQTEVIALATPWQATEAACNALGPLDGKMIIDCTNPLVMTSDGLQLAVGLTTSGGERVAGWCKGASVFKTLNQVGFEVMADTSKLARTPVMFVAGDDDARKPRVLALISDLGFEAIDAGPLKSARLLEPYGLLWIDLALKRGLKRDFAFSLTRPINQA